MPSHMEQADIGTKLSKHLHILQQYMMYISLFFFSKKKAKNLTDRTHNNFLQIPWRQSSIPLGLRGRGRL